MQGKVQIPFSNGVGKWKTKLEVWILFSHVIHSRKMVGLFHTQTLTNLWAMDTFNKLDLSINSWITEVLLLCIMYEMFFFSLIVCNV